MKDDDVGIAIAASMLLFWFLAIGSISSQEKNEEVRNQSSYEESNITKEHSLAKDFESAPNVVKGVKGLSVYKKDGELSRAIEPNHRVDGFNGVILK